jgi:uncharacterized membrane protein YdjX (TVP38/TMEM64 family)
MNGKHQKAVAAAAVLIFIAVCTGLCVFVGIPMVRLAGDPEAFRRWVDGHGAWGRVLYVGIVALQVVVALIPGEPLELAGGYAFGALEGTILALAGIVIGSALVFGLVRRFGVKLVEVFFSREKIDSLSFLKNPKKTRAIAFLLMMIPGTPKDFLSYFAGLTKLRLSEWLAIVTIARIPSVIGSTISGGAVGSEDYLLAAITMGITLALSGAGILYYRHICKEQSEAK